MSTEKDQHVNVFVRIKPLSNRTQSEKSEKYATTMIQATSDTEIIVYERSQTKVSKKLTFDKVFGTASSQIDVYDTVVSPLLKEVLAGYNCTVFAYGQTGTGKTYTMEGGRIEDPNLHWQSDTSAGIIPRCLSHLFDELQLLENQQYIVRVNFLELYNEELFDLLSPSSNGMSKIKLYDDASKKGSIIIHGLEEVTVHNKIEIYKILEKGSEKRQTAATLINANSSRSHTVFSITVHTKEDTADGEELLKTAKLNLVDLAGSENISKSGAINKRAKEARSINQSLLTLGRVITALVEKAPHVPYRESKLTRLLQESLGGRTKTSIIATISSDGGNIDETLSTLDYAYRAKHITNRPEINQKLYKRALLKEYTEEVERLRKDLIATREKNGICLSLDQYDSMHELIEWQKEEIKKRINDFRTLEEDMENRKKVHDNMQSRYDAQIRELTKRTRELSDLTLSLQEIQDSLKMVENDRKEQEYLVDTYVASEKVLRGQTETLLNVVNEALEDARRLHDKIDNKTKAEKENEQLGLQMKDNVTKSMKNIEDGLTVRSKEIEHFFSSVKNEIENDIATQVKSMETSVSSIVKSVIDEHLILTEGITNDMNISYAYYKQFLNKNIKDTSDVLGNEKDLLNTIYLKLAPDIHNLLKSDESIVENLRILNNNVSQKLENVSAYMKNIIETAYKRRFEECNSFRKNLNEINELINYMFLNEKDMLKNYKTFAKKIEDLSRKLTLLDTCEKKYSENIKSSHQIDEICSNMYRQTSGSSNEDIDIYNNLNEFIQNIISQIKSDIDTNINQAQILNRTTIEKGNALVKDLRNNLNTGCTTLKQYNNNVKFDAKQLQNKMDADRNKVITTNIIASSIIENMDYTHVTLMKNQQDKLSNLSTVIDNKLTAQHVKLNNWNDEIVRELNVSQERINEFFTENLYHDVATGTTPPRRQFLYPRQFATQSRERLIQKFRESRSHIEEAKHSDLTVKGKSTSAKQLSISNTPKNITSAKKNRQLYAASTPFKNIQSNTCDLDTPHKSILSPDLSRISLPFIHSEAEAHAEKINKENIKFVKSPKEDKSQESIRCKKGEMSFTGNK